MTAMSLAEDNLYYMLWMEASSISNKKFERKKNNIRHNVRAEIGSRIYCPYCHRRIIKKHKSQYACSSRCKNKLSLYVNAIRKSRVNVFQTD